MEKKNAIILSIATFIAGTITGGASMYFYMKKNIKNNVKEKIDDIILDYRAIGEEEVNNTEHNNLPELIQQDKDKFNEEFNSKQEEEITPFKGKKHRRVESLFGNYKQPTKEEKGTPQIFHPEDEEDKKRYYGSDVNVETKAYPQEQDINEGVDETLDFMEDNVENDDNSTTNLKNNYDDDLDSDLKERDEKNTNLPYTLTREEFDDLYNNNTLYEKETLYWYEGNGILVQNDRHIKGNSPKDELIMEDDDKIIETIGDSTERFGENEDEPDVVYVKNEELCMLYKVIKREENYVFPKV